MCSRSPVDFFFSTKVLRFTILPPTVIFFVLFRCAKGNNFGRHNEALLRFEQESSVWFTREKTRVIIRKNSKSHQRWHHCVYVSKANGSSPKRKQENGTPFELQMDDIRCRQSGQLRWWRNFNWPNQVKFQNVGAKQLNGTTCPSPIYKKGR